MSVKKALGIAGVAVASNVMTPLMALGLPRLRNILGIKIADVRVEHHPAEPPIDEWDEEYPEYYDIKWNSETLTVNAKEKLISGGGDDLRPYTFGLGNGSGDLGIMLLGLPGVLVSAPLIVLFNATWWGVYKLTDMDVNYYLFFRRIKNQLDADTRAILKEALIKTSQANRNVHE